ncbi:DUF4376 domain-containing protein [Oleidesulfovibrio sp.]|uniref:DUF4376 domain-containing protein n=1 Tax=Oleidesulfovibrio sp. TaxID=2909707 RepID=UPI003A8491FA
MQTERPGDDHVASESGAWVLSRTMLLQQISMEKNRRRDSGFMVDGLLWDSDYNARIAYAEVAQRFAADPAYIVPQWKASAGKWVQLDAALFASVQAAGEMHIATVFTWQKAKEEELAALPDDLLDEFAKTLSVV